MEAHAHVEVERVDGRDVVRRLHSAPPLTLRATLDGVHLVGSGAGPLGGDRLALGVRVGAGARLNLASVAAMLAQPGPFGDHSTLDTDLELEQGATLVMRPQPIILVRGCDHRARTRARLAADATLVWREEVVLGRHGEPGGSLRQRLDVELAGLPLLRSETAMGGRWPDSLGPAGIGAARAVGSLLLVGEALDLERLVESAEGIGRGGLSPDTVKVAALVLDGPGILVSVVAERPSQVASALDVVWGAASGADRGAPARW
ncbi:MAG TPA: urease accessory protein UreD [Acidimicrobiales bacterium]